MHSAKLSAAACTLVCLLISGCDNASAHSENGEGAPSTDTKGQGAILAASEALSGKDPQGQTWIITVNSEVKKSDLPSTSDMKLFDFNVPSYIKHKCENYWRYSSCEIYAQIDPSGSLSGYLMIQGDGSSWSFSSDTVTTPRDALSKQCQIGGSIEVTEGEPSRDFSGWSAFSNRNGAEGRIYLRRVGKNIKVNDERWNYCYENRHIDDVYVQIGRMDRKLDPSRWPERP